MSETKRSNDGGPAFPMKHDPDQWCFYKESPEWKRSAIEGMSLRDYFAAAALSGAVANPNFISAEKRVEAAWYYADAMLKARNL